MVQIAQHLSNKTIEIIGLDKCNNDKNIDENTTQYHEQQESTSSTPSVDLINFGNLKSETLKTIYI